MKSIYTTAQKRMVDRLKKARLEAGLEQVEVAKLLGKTQPYVSLIENGQRRLDVIQLTEFARIYKKPVEFFLG